MTKQIKDELIWQGKTFLLEETPGLPKHHHLIERYEPQYIHPLDEYCDITNTTACYRQYIATWEVVDNQLYLVALEGKRQIMQSPIPADWISGRLLAPTRPLGRHVNIRFSPENIEYLQFRVEAGNVVFQTIAKGLHC